MMRKRLFLFLPAVSAASSFWTQPADAQASMIVGTWFGSIVLSNPKGGVSHDTAVLAVGQVSPNVNGSMGRTIDQSTPWVDGSFKNNQLQFHLPAAGGLNVNLMLLSGRLAGSAAGHGITVHLTSNRLQGFCRIRSFNSRS
jgi:hypothetical protein